MVDVKVTEGATAERLFEVYSDPYISRVSHDHRPASPIFHELVTYLSAWVDGQFAGLFLAIKNSPIDFEIHSLLKKQFVKYSRTLGARALDWAFSNQILRVSTFVIEGFESAMNYCIKVGFSVEGVRKSACVQNGVVKNVYCLGITRAEWVK